MSLVQVVFIVVAGWLCLLALGPLVGVTSDLARAMAAAGLVGWIAALIVPGRFRRYQPRPRRDTPIFQGSPTPVEWTQRRSLRIAARTAITNLALLLVTILLGIFLCELALRYFYPKYKYAAEYQYQDVMRIPSRQANARSKLRHPDTGTYHMYLRNKLHMHQHRDFSERDLNSAINVGFFGDSFLDNVNMAVQYSLTEPLDYLLNLSDKRFNTLNFGVGGYGTGQSFLRYEHFRYADKLDYVFYVFTDNDLLNIYAHGLFYLDEAGKLARNEVIKSSWWTRFISRWHITYLMLDVGQRFPFVLRDIIGNVGEYLFRSRSLQRLKEEQMERYYTPIAKSIGQGFNEEMLNEKHVSKYVTIFQQLIYQWKDLVEENGGQFYIVLLPRANEARLATVLGEEFEVVNLYECFSDYVKGYEQIEWISSPYRFRKDGHWNEVGNQLAVVCLYRFLEQETGLPVLPDESLREAFFTYYSSFEGWMPDRRWIKEVPVPPHVQDSIRDKYLALEKDHAGTE